MKKFKFVAIIISFLLVSVLLRENQAQKGGKKTMPDTIKIAVIYDNNPYNSGLQTGWGFAALITGLPSTILFDTGGNGDILLSNMNKMGARPEDIDIVFLSHIHGDHTGGVWSILSANPRVKVYLPVSFPKKMKDKMIQLGATVVEIKEPTKIAPGVMSTGEMGTGIKEQALIIDSAKGPIIITGCAHPGIVNIVQKARSLGKISPSLVVGGFHLASESKKEIEGIVKSFQELGVKKVAPCHCTGDQAREAFEKSYKENFILSGVGATIISLSDR